MTPEEATPEPRPDALGDGELDETTTREVIDRRTDTGLWAAHDADVLRERWREIQLRFVDDPPAATDEAADLVDEAARALIGAIEARRNDLIKTPTGNGGDTEQLRRTVQGYREFLDRVLAV